MAGVGGGLKVCEQRECLGSAEWHMDPQQSQKARGQDQESQGGEHESHKGTQAYVAQAWDFTGAHWRALCREFS